MSGKVPGFERPGVKGEAGTELRRCPATVIWRLTAQSTSSLYSHPPVFEQLVLAADKPEYLPYRCSHISSEAEEVTDMLTSVTSSFFTYECFKRLGVKCLCIQDCAR